ncbi:hypothetical protein EYF80_035369 [Liparis tanakae]|uniref:Uncharacterized protein n=1 Tax=Liparis tanakae TaxID=230148 RepID=A0A4Z2GMK5_9TELE|nr:hypothetical protein EYF80_035369 [Liparis tanakae]
MSPCPPNHMRPRRVESWSEPGNPWRGPSWKRLRQLDSAQRSKHLAD